jgi:flagellar basal body-associated protein FliL
MRKNNIIAIVAIFLLIASSLFIIFYVTENVSAHPPSKMWLEYDTGSEKLIVYIDHESEDPNTHYIETVTVSVNDVEVLNKTYATQELDSEKSVVMYSYTVAASEGDLIYVTAECSVDGSLSEKLIVDSGGEKPPGEDDKKDDTTQKNYTVEEEELPGLPDIGSYNFVTLADLNKDTYPDIIASGAGYGITSDFEPDPGGIHVYLNQNGKSFIDGSNGLPKPGDKYFGSTIGGLSVVDLDGDSNLDIVACEYNKEYPTKFITIFLGNGGEGGSMVWTMSTAPVIQTSWKMTRIGDIDGDGHLDMVASSDAGLHVWRGDHSMGILNWTEATTGIPEELDYLGGIALADINHDGRLDIVAGSEYGDGLFVYTCSQTGEIGWTEAYIGTALPTKAKAWGIELVDLNNDNHLDLIAANAAGYGIMAFLGNGNSGNRSTWWTDVSSGLPTSGEYFQVEVVDIDKDGKLDICSSLHIWSNSGNMSDAESYLWDEVGVGISRHESVGMTIGDLDKDGSLDIVACGWEDQNLPGIHAYTHLSFAATDFPNDGDGKDGSEADDDNGSNIVIIMLALIVILIIVIFICVLVILMMKKAGSEVFREKEADVKNTALNERKVYNQRNRNKNRTM